MRKALANFSVHTILSAEIPGIPKDEVDISVNGNMLTIRAEHKQEEGNEESDQGYRRQYRSFQQNFALPSNVDAEKIQAHCENGMLEVLLPKATASQTRKVEIESGKGGIWNRLTSKKNEANSTQETKKQ